MVQTWKERLGKNKYEILSILLSLAVLCIFVSRKEGFHQDEVLSFELANAKFNPWIVTTQPEGRLAKFVRNEIEGASFGETVGNLMETARDVLENGRESKLLTYQADVYEEPVWITAQQFADYIQVGDGDAFSYLSVYFNVKDDNHPPLHFMLLHTVCSLFRGRAEAWMGCLINLAAAAFVMVLLILCFRLLAQELGLAAYAKPGGIMCAVLYGLSAGAIATTLLIRMYGLLTLWCAAFFYLVLQKWKDRAFDKRNVRLILVTLCGFWTQYFFLFYCICLALAAGVLLYRRKRLRELFCFGRSMAAAAVVGVAAFPFAISDVFSSGRGVEALGNLAAGLSGYGGRLWAFGKILAERTFPLIFWVLFAGVALWGLWCARGRGKRQRDGGKAPYLWMLLAPPAGDFLLTARMAPYLVDRYVMPLFPFVILAVTLGFTALWKILAERYGFLAQKPFWQLCWGMALLLQMAAVLRYDGSYLYRGYAGQERLAEEYAALPCICVYDGVGYYENLPEFTRYEKSLLLTLEQLREREDTESIASLDEVMVLIKPSQAYAWEDVLEILQKQYGFSQEASWQAAGAHGDRLVRMGKGE